MKPSRLVAGTAAIAGAALVLTGCTPPYQYEVIEGTEIHVAWNDILDNFNGSSAAGNNVANSIALYMTGSGWNYYDGSPELIKSPEFGSYEKTSDDPLTVKYTINNNVKWSDGVEVDEADMLLAFITGFGYFNSTDADGATTYLFPHANPRPELVSTLPEFSDHTLTLVYDKPYVDWELQFAVGNVAAHATVMLAYPEITDPEEAKTKFIEAVQNKDVSFLTPVAQAWNSAFQQTDTPSNPLVSLSYGPYIVDELKADQYVALKANPDYNWGPSPKYEKIFIHQYTGATAFSSSLTALENGEIQIASGQPTPDILQIAQGISTANVFSGDEATYEHVDLTFNNGGVFDPAYWGGDEAKALAVRKAFLTTIPRQTIVNELIKPLNPNAEVRESFLVIPGGPGYDTIKAEAGSANYPVAGDVEAAKKILADAGITERIEVKFWYPLGNARRASQYEFIAQNAALAGFDLVSTAEPNWEFTDTEMWPINPHDAVLFAWASTSLAISGSDQMFGTDKPSNFGGYKNSEVDSLLATLEVTTDAAEQQRLQLEVEKLLWADAYGTVIFQFPGLTVASKDLSGVEPGPLAPYYFWNFWEWAPVATAQ